MQYCIRGGGICINKLMHELGLVLGAGLVTWILCSPTAWLLRCGGFWDQPNERSSHDAPTLRGGGVAPLAVIFFTVLFWVYPSRATVGGVWLIGLILLSAINLWDDRRGIAVKWRLLAQLAAAAGVVWALGFGEWSGLTMAVLVFGFVAFMNFINFMDGINGLVAGQVALTALGVALFTGGSDGTVTVISWTITGAMLGFLPFNFPKARIFLGDVGSIGLGFCLGVLGLMTSKEMGAQASTGWLLVLPLYFFMEGTIAVLRRWRAGAQWWTPHREHFYQRLIRSGWSHKRVSGLLWMIQIVVVMFLYWGHDRMPAVWGWLLCGLVWGGVFLYVERVFISTRKTPK